MISVLIPVFNFDVTNLVTELQRQLIAENIPYEFIVIDDHSTNFSAENSNLELFPNLKFIELKKNIGRSKIRNLLASKAIYEWLLFLDADAFPSRDNFISNYLSEIKKNDFWFYCGGVEYKNKKPRNDSVLRWKVGKNREEVGILVRKQSPGRYFFSANFLIKKTLFKENQFNENIEKYGYEDFLFSFELFKKNIEICHVENAIYHLEDEGTETYLKKVKESLSNLLMLKKTGNIDNANLKLWTKYLDLKKYHLNKLFDNSFFYKILEMNLKSTNPSLLIFDIYRLAYLSYLDKVNEED